MDDYVWERDRWHAPSLNLLEIPSSGLPASREWQILYLMPNECKSEVNNGVLLNRDVKHLACSLSRSSPRVKHFACSFAVARGFHPAFFGHRIPAYAGNLKCQMSSAFGQFENLELRITRPCSEPFDDRTDALGFLPDLLGRTVGLRRLCLQLNTEERLLDMLRCRRTALDDTLYTYSQVFPRSGIWPKLESFYISGLAIEGLDLYALLLWQMPSLRRSPVEPYRSSSRPLGRSR